MDGPVTLVHSNFDRISGILDELNLPGVDGMLFDLGVSSPQLDDASRGFSYMHDAPLDMRMDASAPLTAYEVVNTWSYEELRRILFEYGEERYAPAIAKKNRAGAGDCACGNHAELAELIRSAMPAAAPGRSSILPSGAFRRSVLPSTASWTPCRPCSAGLLTI